jgi:arabinose-5-phosphate isomerase
MDDLQIIGLAREVIAREAEAVAAAAEQLDSRLANVARLLADCQGHILVTGAGTSAAVARRFAHLLSCCGAPALPLDASDGLHGGSGAITARDAVYVISKGGRSAEINQLVEIAKGRGARVIAQTETLQSPLAALCDGVLLVRAPSEADLLGGLVALGSSLMNCAVCDALCAIVLQLKGYSRDDFARTHPAGEVGQKLAAMDANAEDAR